MSRLCIYPAIYIVTINNSVPDPGFGAFLTPGSGSGMEKIQKQDPGSGENIPDLIFANLVLVPVFWVKNRYLNSLMRIRDRCFFNPSLDPAGSGSRIRDGKKFRDGIRDPGRTSRILFLETSFT